MRKKQAGAAIMAGALFVAGITGSYAAEVEGVQMEERIQVGSNELVLNGAGLRSRLFFKVYVAGLYLPKKSNSALAILNSSESRRMQLKMLRNVEADTLFTALRDGLAENITEAEASALKAALGQFAQIFQQVGNLRSGDSVSLDFNSHGVTISLNGSLRGKVAEPRLAIALLKVWLGDKPVDAGLKKALLNS